MILPPDDLQLVRTRPQSSELFLSVFKPRIVLQCQINDPAIEKGARTITFDNVTYGSDLAVEPGMVCWIGSAVGLKDIGKTRVKSITPTSMEVAENSDINWADGQFLTVYRFFEILPVYPRIINDPANDENVIFYKDYDIAYTNQNSILGTLINMGSHRAAMLQGGSVRLWYTSSGTATMQTGISLSYDWAFEGGTPTGSTNANPGWVSYTMPGDYVTRLIISGSNGAADTSYRYVSIRNPISSGVSVPYQKWSMESLEGSRDEGGYTASITIYEQSSSIEDGSVVVLFSKDFYGSTEISLGGNQENNSGIFFVGYVMSGSVEFDYQKSTVKFDVGSVTNYLRQINAFSVSVESSKSPTTWYELLDMDIRSALYHYLKWHTSVLLTNDFQYVGENPKVQYFDADRTSIFDAVDNFMRSAMVGKVVSDRQGRMWAEQDITILPTGTSVAAMQLTRHDWKDAPTITENVINKTSYLEMGGIAYSGAYTGSFSALLACAPGDAPAYRGATENIEGLALNSQDHLNQIVKNLYAFRNNRVVSVDLNLSSNYGNLDIAPQIPINLVITPDETVRGLTVRNDFNVNSMSWEYDPKNKMLMPSQVSFLPIVNGDHVETIVIPPVPDGGGYGGGSPSIPALPPFNFPGFYPVTYTWVIDSPESGGIPGPRLWQTRTVLRIDSYIVGGTSVTFNVEQRAVIGTAGQDLMTNDMVSDLDGESTMSITGSAISSGTAQYINANYWLWLDIASVVGGVEKLVVTVTAG